MDTYVRYGKLCIAYIICGLVLSISIQAQWPSTKKNIELQNLPLERVIDSLSAIYEVNFSYDASLTTNKFVKELKGNYNLYEALCQIFETQQVGFDMIEKQVVIYRYINQTAGIPIKPIADTVKIINGQVLDNEGQYLPYASIQIKHKGMATITNQQGFFQLKIPFQLNSDTLIISYVGYQTQLIPISSINEKVQIIKLKEETINIPAVIVQKIDAWEVVKKMLNKIPSNYQQKNIMYTAFYRETARDENEYISIVEALVDIAKAPYNSYFINDQARIFKGRKIQTAKKINYITFKLEGGIYNNIRIDIIKEQPNFLYENAHTIYKFSYVKSISYNEREMYVINFEPYKDITDDLTYQGTLYIDKQTFALVGAEFSLSKNGIAYARSMLVKRTPKKTTIKPVEARYIVFYRNYNNYWYLDYTTITLKVKAKSSKWFFNNTFISVSQMLVTDIDTTNHSRFRWNEIVKSSDIIIDKIENNDESFWGNYNIITPDEPITEAVKRLSLNNNPTDEQNSFWKILFK